MQNPAKVYSVKRKNIVYYMQSGQTADIAVSAFLFGVVYSVSLTPCIGAFLGSALALAGASGTAVKGVLLLVTYSLGLGVPFLLSALLIEKLNTAFSFIKKHYRVINIVCGSFLILIGILMACGLMDALVSIFS